MSAWSERACTRHSHDPVEAVTPDGEPELATMGTLTYRVLRCPVCQRPQGMRIIRKAKVAE